MKIILFGPAYPLRGGMAHFIAMLHTHLTKRGHDVSIVSFTRQYPKFLFPGKTQEESGDAGIQVPSTALIDSINPLNWIAHGLKLRKENADLVISTFWIPFLAPSSGTLHALLRTKKTKTLTILHNLIPHEKRPGDMILTRWLIRFTDYFIAQSASVERDLLSLLPSAKYKRVALPMFDLFHHRIRKEEARKQLGITDEKVIMFFGYIRDRKSVV